MQDPAAYIVVSPPCPPIHSFQTSALPLYMQATPITSGFSNFGTSSQQQILPAINSNHHPAPQTQNNLGQLRLTPQLSIMSNLTIKTSITTNEQQIQQLLEQQAAIQAQIDSLSASSPQHYYRSPIHKQHQHRRRDVPRSMSSTGIPMSRNLSSDRAEAAVISRSLSQRSAPSMTRTNSRGSNFQRNTSNTTARPLPLASDTRLDNSLMMDWTTQEQPFSSYTSTHQIQNLQRSTSQHRSELQRVPEHGRILEDLADPSEYISNMLGAQITPVLSISPPMPELLSNRISGHRSSTSSYDFQTPSTPSTAPLTLATTIDNSTLSRENSLFNDHFETMMRISSSTSYSDISHVDHAYDHVTPISPSSIHIRCSSSEEQKQLLAGAGGASHDSQFPDSLTVHLQSPVSFGTKMVKSDSNESISSASSLRNKMRLKLQNQHAAARPLMPRGGDEKAMSRSNSSQSILRSDSNDGSQDKLAISKPTYRRPTHERVFCKQCESHTEGFRGEHELRRHHDREHKQLVKKWVCIEPVGDRHEKPIYPLSKCKACSQSRTYNAYYNAAAHLRRAHFKPKMSKGRSKGKKEVEEKRGGKGGGDWPSMSELKFWMKEVEVPALGYKTYESQQDEADGQDEEVDTIFENLHTSTNIVDYRNAFSTEGTPFTYPKSNVTDMGFYTPITLDAESHQSMDQSIYGGFGQNNFHSFFPQVSPNDVLPFLDTSLSQNFEDPSLNGSNFENFSY